jgi:hypothetical protein
MKIRRKLNEDETLYEVGQVEELFLGGCHGVALVKRGENDRHVCFLNLTEDDGAWFNSLESSSSHWMFEHIEVMKAAYAWLEENGEPDIHNDIQYGWKFKK